MLLIFTTLVTALTQAAMKVATIHPVSIVFKDVCQQQRQHQQATRTTSTTIVSASTI